MKRFLENGKRSTKKQRTQPNRMYDDSDLQFGFVVKSGSENSTPLPVNSLCNLTKNAFKSKHEAIVI